MLNNSLEELSILEFAEKCKEQADSPKTQQGLPPLGLWLTPSLPTETPPPAAFVDLCRAGRPLTSPAQWSEVQVILQHVLFLYLVLSPYLSLSSLLQFQPG